MSKTKAKLKAKTKVAKTKVVKRTKAKPKAPKRTKAKSKAAKTKVTEQRTTKHRIGLSNPNTFDEEYFKIIKLYMGITELTFSYAEPDEEDFKKIVELKKQLPPQIKSAITRNRNKLKKTRSKKLRDEIKKKIYNLEPHIVEEPIEMPTYITYTVFVVFNNGKVIRNPLKSDLIKFNNTMYSEYEGHFNESYLKYVNSSETDIRRKATYEENKLGSYKLNLKEFNKLIDLEIQLNDAIQSTGAGKIANDYLTSVQVIKEEFRNWFELNGYPIPGDSGTNEVKNVQTSELEDKTEQTKKNITENSQITKKNKEDVKWIKWLESRDNLILFLQELQIAGFIHKEDDIEKLAGDHFQVISENDFKTTDSQVKKIRWTQVPYELNYLIELCMNADYQLIRKEYKHHLMKCKHFADIEGNDFDSDVFNRAKSNKNAGRKGEGRGKVTYAPSLLSGEFLTILNKVKSKN